VIRCRLGRKGDRRIFLRRTRAAGPAGELTALKYAAAGPGHQWYNETRTFNVRGQLTRMAHVPYGTGPITWVKIKNPAYSQAIGRRERFEQMRARRPSPATA